MESVPDDRIRAYGDVTEMIGRTPLLRLARLAPAGNLYAKCELRNPIAVKDRIALQIVLDAEADGRLRPGDTLIECTSGNTGMAVAYVAAVRGYRAILVMSEIQSVERRQVLKALGAELVLTPASEGTAGARRKLRAICDEHPEYVYVGQHVNPSNPRAHERTTGPEIWEDTGGRVDVVVAPLGTGGTICGSGRFLKSRKPSVRLLAVEPEESPFISKGIFRPHRMMGTAPGFVPETLDREVIDEIRLVSEPQAFAMCRRIAREEGVLVGISSGAAAHVALAVAEEEPESTVITFFCDSGERYLSVEGLFDGA